MSKRHPGARRVRHSSSSEPDDIFVARVLSLGKWAESNQQVLTVAAVVVAIAIFGIVSYGNSRRSMNVAAAQQLEMVHQSIGIADVEGAKADLVTFLDRFAGSAYEGEARLLLGELYLETDDSQQAIAVLRPIGASPSAPIELQAAMLLAAAYEQEERWTEAEAAYLSVARRSDLSFQIRDALGSAARIRSAEGDASGAIELYQRVLDGLQEDAPQRGQFQMRIAELRAAIST